MEKIDCQKCFTKFSSKPVLGTIPMYCNRCLIIMDIENGCDMNTKLDELNNLSSESSMV